MSNTRVSYSYTNQNSIAQNNTKEVHTLQKRLKWMQKETDPALNIMGGKRYMKKRSSLKTRRCELFPLLINKMTTPVASPCDQKRHSAT